MKSDKEIKRLECIYCNRVAIHTVRFETYVCDDCYKQKQIEKKELLDRMAEQRGMTRE
tara:strand:- start:497 stop:670 length:174 start_codon:yes stop_codon:yes gene_type:complete